MALNLVIKREWDMIEEDGSWLGDAAGADWIFKSGRRLGRSNLRYHLVSTFVHRAPDEAGDLDVPGFFASMRFAAL